MVRNVEGLKRSARSRSAETMAARHCSDAADALGRDGDQLPQRRCACASLNGVALRNQSSESCNHESTSILRRLPRARICNIGNGSRMNGSWQLSDSAFARWRKSIAN